MNQIKKVLFFALLVIFQCSLIFAAQDQEMQTEPEAGKLTEKEYKKGVENFKIRLWQLECGSEQNFKKENTLLLNYSEAYPGLFENLYYQYKIHCGKKQENLNYKSRIKTVVGSISMLTIFWFIHKNTCDEKYKKAYKTLEQELAQQKISKEEFKTKNEELLKHKYDYSTLEKILFGGVIALSLKWLYNTLDKYKADNYFHTPKEFYYEE